MKKFLLAFLAVLVVTTALAETVVFSTENAWPKNGSYTSTSSTINQYLGSTWAQTNFNNNNNSTSWKNIRCGSKSAASVASIVNDQALDVAVSEIVVNANFPQSKGADYLNSVKLYISADKAFPSSATTVVSCDNFKTAGDWKFEVPQSVVGVKLFYKLEFDCLKHTANGFVGVNSLTFTTVDAEPDTRQAVSLSFPEVPEASYSVNIGDSFTAPVLTCEPEAVVGDLVFTSSNPAVATVDASTGAVTIAGVGEATITASFEGNDDYKAAAAEYTITVTDPNMVSYSIVFNDSSSDASTVTSANALLGTGTNNYFFSGREYVSSIPTVTYIFKGKTGLKFSSGSNNGELTINLSDDGKVNAYSIVISAKQFSSDASKLSVNGSAPQTITGNTECQDYTFTFDKPTSLSTITLSAVKRVYVKSITVYYERKAPKVKISKEVTDSNDATITLSAEGATIHYGFSESEIKYEYTEPFTVTENCTVYAYSEIGGKKGEISSSEIKLYKSLKDIVTGAKDNESVTVYGDFSVLYQSGLYLMLTDGSSNIFVYGNQYQGGNTIKCLSGKVQFYNEMIEITDAKLTEGGNGAEYVALELTTLEGLNYVDNLFDQYTLKSANIIDKTTISLGEETITLYNPFGLTIKTGENYDITGFVWRNKDICEFVPISIVEADPILTVETPIITPNKKELKVDDVITITCATEGATIYYTLNGDVPTQESTRYVAPIAFEGSDFTIKACAFYEGEDQVMLPSEVAERTYHVFNPYCNVITKDNHEGSLKGYTKHYCEVDGVQYAMFGMHDNTKGIQMKNQIDEANSPRFCYIVQTGDNEGLALESIEVDFNAAMIGSETITIFGSNTPYEVYADKPYDLVNEYVSITDNGVKIGEISAENPKVVFTKDFNYFAFFPTNGTCKNALYMNSITINYRDPLPMADAPVIDDDFAENFDGDEYSFMFWGVPGHEDWTAYYTLNDGEVREAETGGDGVNVHEDLEAATLHTIKIWYEHYYYPEKSTVYEFHHVTQPEFIFDENKAEGKSVVVFGTIGEGVTVYFTLNGTEPVVPEASPARVMRRTGVSEDGTYVIDSHDDYDKTHVVPQSGMVDIKHGVIYDGGSKDGVPDFYQFRAVAVHDNGTKSAIVENDDIPTSIREVGAAEAGNGAVYDLMGRKVVAPVRGLYIQNGAKRLVR